MSTLVPRHILCALSASLLFSLPTSAQDIDVSTLMPGSLRGQAALDRLGDGLDELAAANDLTAEQLRTMLRDDETVWLSADDRLFFVDPMPTSLRDDPPAPAYAFDDDIPPSEAFNLASRPSANKTIYLDFNGHHSVGNSWGHNIVFPAYNTSGDSSSFSTSELNQIIAWWKRVVEDFAPFDVNVTTIEPPLSDLVKSNSGDQRYGVRCVQTQATGGFGGFGGIALLNSFNDSIDNPCFSLNKGENTGSQTVSHEAGHTLGLSHDGLNGSTYHPGTGGGETSWGPLMGAPFSSNLVHWSNGDYSGATTSQNDLNIITKSANGFGFLADDHGDDRFSASPVSDPVGCPTPTPGTAEGLIHNRNDVDAFEFTTTGGIVTISAIPYEPGPNIDIELTIQNSGGTELGVFNPVNDLDASATLDLAAGTYYALVDGVGKTGSYSDYGSIGRYQVSVSAAGQEAFTDLGGGLGNSFGLTPTFTVSGVLCEGNDITYSMGLAAASSNAFLVLGFSELNLPFKGGTLVPNPGPPGAIVGFVTNFLGGVTFSAPWPAAVPSGFEMVMQYWVQDFLGPVGFTASNAVKIVAP